MLIFMVIWHYTVVKRNCCLDNIRNSFVIKSNETTQWYFGSQI